ncbi:Protein of unknown function [Gryllus bimaculatus]|nr:Protein of unknown function [Gryllus bimaculatus]
MSVSNHYLLDILGTLHALHMKDGGAMSAQVHSKLGQSVLHEVFLSYRIYPNPGALARVHDMQCITTPETRCYIVSTVHIPCNVHGVDIEVGSKIGDHKDQSQRCVLT